MRFFICFLAAALAYTVAAAPAVHLEKRAFCDCGGNSYHRSQVTSAIQLAQISGGRGYPHEFYNNEAITGFQCSGSPYYEYPIGNRLYTGGPPGADRVVYDAGGAFCGCITHTGAPTPDGFVACAF